MLQNKQNKESMKVMEVNGGGLDKLRLVDRETPHPKAGEVSVRWHATSLNYHDYLVACGGIPVSKDRIPMSDGAGEIIALGEGVTNWNIGDKVMSLFFPGWIDGPATYQKMKAVSGESVDGYITEQSSLSAKSITKIPESYSFAEAATLPCAAVTAWRALVTEGQMKAGDTVLIEGTGGMSIAALQLAKAKGATIIATTSSPEKAERLKAMGASEVINYKEDIKWGKTIFKMTGGGVDHVLDVGGGSTMVQSIEAARIGGSIISIGILGDRKGEITFPKLFFKQLTLKGIAVDSKASQEAMIKFINQSDFRPIIHRSFAFDQLADAFRYQETGKHFGKIVVEW